MRHQDDRGVEAHEMLLEPLERLDIEVVGRLVEQQQVGIARERPPERGTRQLPAREGHQCSVEIDVIPEAQAVKGCERPVPPAVPAGVLEPGLRLGISAERLLVVGALRHRVLEL